MVGELIPHYALKNVHDTVEFNKTGVKGLAEFNALTSDYHDLSSEWVEDFIAQTFHRRATDKESDRELLFLFRLLVVKYRIRYPMVNKELVIDENIVLFLERWICQSFMDYYMTRKPGFEWIL